MCEKLFRLCQLQLGSIVSDLENSVGSVNSATANIMQCLNDQQRGDADGVAADAVFDKLGDEARSLVMGLQFHDELTQRLEHLQDLLILLQEQRRDEDEAGDSDKLLSRLSKIFSSNAEFKQLKEVFPGCQVAGSTEAIELF